MNHFGQIRSSSLLNTEMEKFPPIYKPIRLIIFTY